MSEEAEPDQFAQRLKELRQDFSQSVQEEIAKPADDEGEGSGLGEIFTVFARRLTAIEANAEILGNRIRALEGKEPKHYSGKPFHADEE
jgi:hypothetical protein